jgi:hypothetical protein
MVNYRRLKNGYRGVHQRLFVSPETGLQLELKRYLPSDIYTQVEYNTALSEFFNPELVKRERIRHKKDEKFALNYLYSKVLKAYFDWAITKAIEGHVVKLLGGEKHLIKVQAYYPTDVENRRIQFLKDRHRIKKYFTPDDFRAKRYRVAIYELKPDGHYKPLGYFFKLIRRHKKMLLDQVRKDTGIYVTNITI